VVQGEALSLCIMTFGSCVAVGHYWYNTKSAEDLENNQSPVGDLTRKIKQSIVHVARKETETLLVRLILVVNIFIFKTNSLFHKCDFFLNCA